MRIVPDRTCPKCRGQLATDGRREWCPAVVPETGGEPCGYSLRGGLDRPDLWRYPLILLMARIKAAGWRDRNRRIRGSSRRPMPNFVEQVPR